jgi:hypothetical protein
MKTAMVDKNAHYFEFLDFLRESGKTNMFGAVPYLIEAFEIDRKTARRILRDWMNSFEK